MKYTYNQYLYIPEAICCLVLSLIVGLTLTQTFDHTIGIGVAITGCIISGLFHMAGQSRSRFIFAIQGDGLIITRKKITIKILWADIYNIREDNMGLHIHSRSTGGELPILNDMVGYDDFKEQLISMWRQPKQFVVWATK